MREKSRENQTIRTVRRKRIQDLLAVLFFLLLLPYTCSVVGGIAAGGDAVKTMAGAKHTVIAATDSSPQKRPTKILSTIL